MGRRSPEEEEAEDLAAIAARMEKEAAVEAFLFESSNLPTHRVRWLFGDCFRINLLGDHKITASFFVEIRGFDQMEPRIIRSEPCIDKYMR